jgi:hypothetical protein
MPVNNQVFTLTCYFEITLVRLIQVIVIVSYSVTTTTLNRIIKLKGSGSS